MKKSSLNSNIRNRTSLEKYPENILNINIIRHVVLKKNKDYMSGSPLKISFNTQDYWSLILL